MKQTNFEINVFSSTDVAQNYPMMVKIHLLIKYLVNTKVHRVVQSHRGEDDS